ncbi:MAG TPA: flagellar biosynthetic protein FliO, partial [Candidatus Synoicihabitans sp.]|nr:flagellar biosynthetic protein FliO [Candidatus Synoicihabitans sp.]
AESAPAAPAEVPPAGESAPAEPTAAPKREAEERRADTLLIPGGMPRAGVGAPSASPSASWVVVLLFCAAGAAWWWWRRRGDSPLGRGQRTRLIQIVESRPLGNRQYLVVATVEDRRFLLGVTPGSIQMLSPLATKEEAVHEPAA